MKLTIDEISRCLDLPVKKVERWIAQGRIPVKQDERICLFNSSALEKWASTHRLSFRLPNDATPTGQTTEKVRDNTLLSAMERGGVFHDIDGDDIDSVLAAATSQLPIFSEDSKQILYRRLLEREHLMSTGIGKGVAIPHPRTPLGELGKESILATFFLKDVVDYGAIDDKPVFVLFILLSPTTREHLNLLSRLAFCVRNDAFVSFLNTTPGAKQLFSKIEVFEQKLE